MWVPLQSADGEESKAPNMSMLFFIEIYCMQGVEMRMNQGVLKRERWM